MKKAWKRTILACALAGCQPQTIDLGSSKGGPDGSTINPVGEAGPAASIDCEGGSCMTLAVDAIGHPVLIAVDGSKVYWTTPVGGSNGVSIGFVKSVPVAGGTPSTLASGQNFPFGIAVDSTSVYWTTLAPSSGPQVVNDGRVQKLPVAGGPAAQLVGNRTSGCMNVAVGKSGVYWIEDGGGVFGVPLGGGPVTTIGATEDRHGGIAVDATRAYWTDTTLGIVEAAPLAGGTSVTLAAAQDRPYGIAVDSENVYWTTSDSVLSAPLAGGTPTTIATGQAEPWYVGDRRRKRVLDHDARRNPDEGSVGRRDRRDSRG